MRHTLLFIALLAPLTSAQRFHRVLGSASDERATAAALVPGGGFAIAGAQANGALVLVLAANGEPQGGRALQGSADARVLAETNGFVIVADVAAPGAAFGLAWTRVDAIGTPIASHTFPGTAIPNDGRPPGLATSGAGFVLAGQRALAPSIAQAPHLAYLDQAGNVLVLRDYQDLRFADDAFGDFAAVRLLGGDTLVAGSTGVQGLNDTRDALVARIGPSGLPIWARTFGSPLADDRAFALSLAANGDLLVSGADLSIAGGGAFVLRVANGGSAAWRVEIPGFAASASIAERADGAIAIAGTSGGHAALALLSGGGELLLARAYPAGASSFGAAVLALTDGGFFLAGTAGGDLLAVRTDALLRVGCSEVDLTLAAVLAPRAAVDVPLILLEDLGQNVVVAESVSHDLVQNAACVLDFVTVACPGDGSLATDCPCGNRGIAGRGCANSVEPDGAALRHLGVTQPDALVFEATGLPSSISPSVILFQGDAFEAAGSVFGDGLRCASGTLVRLGVVPAPAGVANYPPAGGASISLRGGVVPGSGELRWYQAYFRNAAASFCPPATFNATNALRVLW